MGHLYSIWFYDTEHSEWKQATAWAADKYSAAHDFGSVCLLYTSVEFREMEVNPVQHILARGGKSYSA